MLNRIDRMNFRAGDGWSDPAWNEVDRGNGVFLGGDTASLLLERMFFSILQVEADRESSIVRPSRLDWLSLL